MPSELLQFDEKELRASLVKLQPSLACAIGLASCFRNLGSIADYREKAGLLPNRMPFDVAARLWDMIIMPAARDAFGHLAGTSDELIGLIPGDDDPWNDSADFADDALAALAYCVSVISENNPENAAYALRRTYEAVDHLAIGRLDLAAVQKQDEIRILSSHCVQLELHRQMRDQRLALSIDLETLIAMARTETIFDESPLPS
jgi:hypothetical protein